MTDPGGPTPSLSRARAGLLLLLLIVASGWRWQTAVREPTVKPDEAVYLAAARLWSEGASPYQETIFFYTPFYAATAAWLIENFGDLGFLQIQRIASLLGINVTAWLALLIAGWRFWPALVAGIAWLWLAPAVALPTELGNAVGLATALTLTAFYLWARYPLSAGASLGLGLAIKPIAALAPACFLAQAASRADRSALRTGISSAITGGLFLLVGARFLPGIFGNATGSANPYNFSLQQVLSRFGLNVRPLWILLALGLAAVWWIYSRKLSEREFLVNAITWNLLVTPILWAYSLLLLFPIQLLAVGRMAAWLRDRTSPRLPHLLAGLAIASTLFTETVGGLADAPSWLQGAALAMPLLSIGYLGYYTLGGSID